MGTTASAGSDIGTTRSVTNAAGGGFDGSSYRNSAIDNLTLEGLVNEPQLSNNPTDAVYQPEAPARYTARRGDSISEILGTSDPVAVEAFMRANNLKDSTIYAGKDYALPSEAHYAASTGQLGQATLDADNVRLAEYAARDQMAAEARGLTYFDEQLVHSLSTPTAASMVSAPTYTAANMSVSDMMDMHAAMAHSVNSLRVIEGIGDGISNLLSGIGDAISDVYHSLDVAPLQRAQQSAINQQLALISELEGDNSFGANYLRANAYQAVGNLQMAPTNYLDVALEAGGIFGVFGKAGRAAGMLDEIGEIGRIQGRTNAELVQDIAARADTWGVRNGLGNGPVAGTLKHGYADELLTRYQSMFGSRGLTTEVRYFEGKVWEPGMQLRGSIRLDVVEGPLNAPTAVYDYKFGSARLTTNRVEVIRSGANLGYNVPVVGVHP